MAPELGSAMVARLRGPFAAQPAENDSTVVTLYHGFSAGFLSCIFSCKVRMTCEMLGQAYRIVEVDLDDKPAWFGDISPKLESPVMYVEGKLITDSADAVEALRALFASGRGVGRAGAQECARRESALSAEDSGATLGAFFGILCTPPGSDGEAGAMSKWNANMEAYEEVLRSESSPYLCGASPGVMDLQVILVRVSVAMLEQTHGWKGREKVPHVMAWISRMESLDAMRWSIAGTGTVQNVAEHALHSIAVKVPPAAAHLEAARDRILAELARPTGSRRSLSAPRLCLLLTATCTSPPSCDGKPVQPTDCRKLLPGLDLSLTHVLQYRSLTPPL